MKKTKNISEIQLITTIIFIVSFLISNIIASKQFVLPFNIVMTGAVILFPVTYILSDIFSEIYGYKWSRITCYMAFAFNVFMVLIFYIAIKLPPAGFWGNQPAFETILGCSLRILIASMSAFVIGDFINDKIFKRLKLKHTDNIKGFGFRAIFSSIFGEFADSFIFITIAFAGIIPLKDLPTMIIFQAVIKILYEIILLPVNCFVVKKISDYESKIN